MNNDISKIISDLLVGQAVTPQVNIAGSNLTVVLNRKSSSAIDYQLIAENILSTLRASDTDGIQQVKFYGRQAGKKPEWQHMEKLALETESVDQNKLQQFNSGKPVETPKLFNMVEVGQKTITNLGWSLFAVGVFMLGVGLIYDPTVGRVYNDGKLNIKTTYTNTGGFIAACGAIFISTAYKERQN